MGEATYRDAYKIVGFCVIWYISSSANNIVGKIILSDFPYPMTVSMVQLVSISLYLFPIIKLWQIPPTTQLPLKYWFTMILPLAAGKFFSSVSSHISIWKVPVSYAHTVKATLPMFTVFLSRLILKEKQTTKVYLSLIPIIGGVLIATATELSFNMVGLISALAATVGFSLQSIFSKKCLKETGIHHLRLLFVLSSICAVAFTPLWLAYDFSRIIQDTSLINSTHTPRLIALLIIDGFLNCTQNLIAFSIIAMLMPLSYAVANATKRISIITVSLLTLRNPVTGSNIFGMMTAVVGVLLYNKAKYDHYQATRKEVILPTLHVVNGNIIDETPPLLDNLANYKKTPLIPSILSPTINHKDFQDRIYFHNPTQAEINIHHSQLHNNSVWNNSNNQNMLSIPKTMPKAYSAVSLDSMT